MTRIVGVVPARMAASRFPGKPLVTIHGRSMLEHVYRRAAACAELAEVVVATCDDAIAEAAAGFGARVIMTSAAHQTATDRVAEAAADDPAEIVVMIQGDEPMITPAMIAAAVEPLLGDPALACTDLTAAIASEEELLDPNTIKVVMAADGRAQNLSRQPLPPLTGDGFRPGESFKQVCVIAFRHAALNRFSRLARGRLERVESIDMLRFLEHGIPVLMVPTAVRTHAVDTIADLEIVLRLMAEEAEG